MLAISDIHNTSLGNVHSARVRAIRSSFLPGFARLRLRSPDVLAPAETPGKAFLDRILMPDTAGIRGLIALLVPMHPLMLAAMLRSETRVVLVSDANPIVDRFLLGQQLLCGRSRTPSPLGQILW